jgi:hypothetical protein
VTQSLSLCCFRTIATSCEKSKSVVNKGKVDDELVLTRESSGVWCHGKVEEAAFRSVLTAENEGDRKMEGIWLRRYWEED